MNDNGSYSMLPFRSNVSLRAEGRWGGGGFVAIEQEGDNRSLLLPPALFDLLATLILRARQSSPRDFCLAETFLGTTELCLKLRRRTRGTTNPLDPDPPNLAKYVYRLRHLLELPELVEHERHLGYRLSTPPENLTLRILDEEPADHD